MRTVKLGKTKKGLILAIGVFVLIAASFRAGTVFGAGAEPGSSGDPLITQSYLEAELAKVETGGFRKIAVKKGVVLKAESGSMLVLYSGSAEVSSAGGIVNLMEAKEASSGDNITKFQSYLVPEKGRGIKALSDCVFFLLGDYIK